MPPKPTPAKSPYPPKSGAKPPVALVKGKPPIKPPQVSLKQSMARRLAK